MKTKTNCLYLLILVVIQGFAINGVPLHEVLQSRKDYKRSLTTDGWFIGSNGKQYQLTKNENGFYETGDICQAIGGDLVTINNVKDQEAVNEFVTASQLKNGRYFWIGLHEGSSRVGAPWIWEKTNQLATHFLNWAPEQPISHDALNDCGAIGVDGTWFSRNCDMKLVGICEKQAAPGNGNAQSGQSTSGTSTEKPKEAPKTTENVVAQIPATQDNATEGTKVSPNGNQGAQTQVNDNQEAAVTEEMKKKFNNGERCNLVNFINHIGKPVIISRRVNDRLKEYIVEGENYKMNTLFKKVENVLKMEPVVYSARESGDGRKRLALDGLDSLTLMPGDCDGDFVDVIISPRSIEKDTVGKQSTTLRKRHHTKHNDDRKMKIINRGYNNNVSMIKRLAKPRCQVETFGGNSGNDASCCQFPFKYNNRLYHDCTTTDKHHLWCGTTRNFDRDGKWGYCCEHGECTN
eukprot:gene4866-5505_t